MINKLLQFSSKIISFIITLILPFSFIFIIYLAGMSVYDTKNINNFTAASENQELYAITQEVINIKSLKIDEKLDFDKIKEAIKKVNTLKNGEKIKIRELIDGLNEIKSHQDLESFSKIYKDKIKNLNIIDEIEAETYVNYLNSKTIIIAVAVGFLSIFLIIQIEGNRLNNERTHYRKQASQNLSDILNFSMNLMGEINRKHVKFMFTGKEIKSICKNFDCKKIFTIKKTGICTEKEYDYLKRFYTFDSNDKKKYCLFGLPVSKYNKNLKLLDEVYFSISFLKTLLLNKNLRKDLKIDDKEELLKLQQLYSNAILKNYLEHLSSIKKEGKTIHSINEEVKNIPENIEEIILKRDFEIDDLSSKRYLDILDNIKKFENIQETKTETLLKEKLLDELSQPNKRI